MTTKILDKRYWREGISFLKNNKPIVLTLIFLLIPIDIFFINNSSDLRIFGILALCIISILIYKLKSRLTFMLCLIILGIMYIEFLFTGTSQATEKSAVWLFLFLAVGIFQQLKEQ